MTRPTGKVKWYDSDKGYGFIVADNLHGELFLDSSSVRRQQPNQMFKPFAAAEDLPKCLTSGSDVSFDVSFTRGGRMRATNVDVLDTDEIPERLTKVTSSQSVCNQHYPLNSPTRANTPSTESSLSPKIPSKTLSLRQLLDLADMLESAKNIQELITGSPRPLELSTLLGL